LRCGAAQLGVEAVGAADDEGGGGDAIVARFADIGGECLAGAALAAFIERGRLWGRMRLNEICAPRIQSRRKSKPLGTIGDC
jgi:hypothetical protein